MYEEDYWDNYGQFNEEIENLAASLKLSVKKEVKETIERLEKENKELREKQANLTKLTREVEEAKRQAQYEKENARRDVMRVRYSELMETLEKPKYFVGWKSKRQDKCDQCDENRKVVFRASDGREKLDSCTCADYINDYTVEEAFVYYIYNRDSKDIAVYDVTKDDECRQSSSNVYAGEDFSKLRTYDRYLFDTKEKAQEYADYLNNKHRK